MFDRIRRVIGALLREGRAADAHSLRVAAAGFCTVCERQPAVKAGECVECSKVMMSAW